MGAHGGGPIATPIAGGDKSIPKRGVHIGKIVTGQYSHGPIEGARPTGPIVGGRVYPAVRCCDNTSGGHRDDRVDAEVLSRTLRLPHKRISGGKTENRIDPNAVEHDGIRIRPKHERCSIDRGIVDVDAIGRGERVE